jgi:hypothetical protein
MNADKRLVVWQCHHPETAGSRSGPRDEMIRAFTAAWFADADECFYAFLVVP